jgi:hypothetical protein
MLAETLQKLKSAGREKMVANGSAPRSAAQRTVALGTEGVAGAMFPVESRRLMKSRCAFPASAILLLVVAGSAYAAEWTAGPLLGQVTDSAVAWISNEEGHTLILRGEADGDAYWLFAEFHVAAGQTLARVMPTFQVDDGHAPENEWQLDHKQWGKIWGGMDTSIAWWVVASYPKEEYAEGKVLRSWFNGKEVAIIYQSVDGATKRTRFPLAGLKSAIVAATGWDFGE